MSKRNPNLMYFIPEKYQARGSSGHLLTFTRPQSVDFGTPKGMDSTSIWELEIKMDGHPSAWGFGLNAQTETTITVYANLSGHDLEQWKQEFGDGSKISRVFKNKTTFYDREEALKKPVPKAGMSKALKMMLLAQAFGGQS